MMKYILYLFILFSSFYCSAQELINSKLSDCEPNAYPELIKQRVSRKELFNDTLLLSIGFKANCCIDPEPKTVFENDTLFIFKNNVSTEWCACDCCFELDFQITGILDTNFTVIVDGIEFIPSVSSRVKLPDEYHFDRDTPVNQGNADNLKIGLWRTYYDNSKKVKTEEYFSEEWDEPIRVWFKTYDKKGNLTSIGIRTTPTSPMLELEPEVYFQILSQ